MSLNKVMLIGNAGRDPEVRYVDGNDNQGNKTKVASFTLATSERYTDRQGNKQEQTEWHNIVAWRGLADVTENYIRKGTQIYVEGRLRTRSWEDKNNVGVKHYQTEVLAERIQLLGKRSDNPAADQSAAPAAGGFAQPAAAAPKPAPVQPQYPSSDGQGGDDLPF